MKNLNCIIIIFFMASSIFSQNGVPEFDFSTPVSTHYTYGAGGYKLPSEGSINILMVFAEFPDDQYDTANTRWVKGQPPQNMDNWVDFTWSNNPTQGSLTHYFNDMSFDKLKITGKEIYVTAPHTRYEYYNMNPSKKRGHIQKEILQQIDITEDFSPFDNWGLIVNYSHDNNPDTKVDMIVFIWRNTTQDSSIYGSNGLRNLEFGAFGDLGRIGSFDVDSGQRHIDTQTFGSGVSVPGYLITNTYGDPFRLVTHEFTHFLLGYNDMHNGFAFWGMLSDWGVRSLVANSFERYQLNWINDPFSTYTLDATTTTVQTITKYLGDFITTGKSIRVIVDASTDEYIYIENHQNQSYWETHRPFSANPDNIYGYIEPGIYIIRQTGMSTPYIPTQFSKMLIPADGRSDWEAVGSIVNPYEGTTVFPLWQNNGPDRNNGYHTLELVPHNYPSGENPATITFIPSATSPYWENISEIAGDEKDAFKIGYKEVFSPWSNPNNQRENKTTVNFAMELKLINGNGGYTLTFFMNNPENAKPSKPENLSVTWNGDHPLLTWNKNEEPDMKEYKIYQKIEGETGWTVAATVTHTSSSTQSWTDYLVDKPGKFDPVYTYSYEVAAVDNDDNLSVRSLKASIDGTGLMWKNKVDNNNNEMPTSFKLFSNYPNPFNPATLIRYSIKENGLTSLKVYDILGKEVATLVNENETAGNYSVEFNAGRLPSGIYIYRLISGNFTDSKN